MSQKHVQITIAVALIAYWALANQLRSGTHHITPEQSATIALSPTAEVILYGGDRFLAANIEAIRTITSVTSANSRLYLLKSHLVISQLNPCHEDNYWVGNASLSWGGAEEKGFKLLKAAMRCRFWDEWPAFFYGFNQNFFLNNVDEAKHFLEIAASRSHDNAAVFLTYSIMLKAGRLKNTTMAIKMLTHERDSAKEPKLRDMLNKRITRLNGLLLLRQAQKNYEEQFGKPLTNPQELLTTGLLKHVPRDPLNLGYEFRNNTFQLKRMQVR